MTRIRSLAPVVFAAALAACQAGSPSPAATTAASAPATTSTPVATTPTFTPSPTVALGPAVTLALDSSGPIVRSTDGPAGRQYVLPAAAARDAAGGYVLFIVWFGPTAGDQVVTMARSDDGRTWRLGKEAILTDLGMALANPGPIPSAAIQLEDGSWLLYGWAAHLTDTRSLSSWRASAPQPEGPWKLDAEVVLAPGPPGSWDAQSTSIAGVHYGPDGYALWYEGQPPGSSVRGDVGYATSTDGLAWTKFDDPATTTAELAAGDPVIRRGICGAGSEQAVFQAQVEPVPGGYLAVLGGFGVTSQTMDLFGATSPDGSAWVCGSETPILRSEDIPGGQGIHTIASMPLDDGRVALFIESLGDATSDVWLATVEVAG